MTEINVCPCTLAEGFQTYSPAALRQLFDGVEVSHILPFNSPNSDTEDNREYTRHVGRISLSGVQPKASLLLLNGQLQQPSADERGQYILKPAPTSYTLLERKYCPANEHLSMQLASQIYHIETAANAICFFRDGEAAYVCRRFDVAPDGSKYQQEDFASLGGLTKANGGADYKYSNLSYEECAQLIQKYTTASAIDGEYHLSPAYDLVNTSLHLYEPRIFALDKGLFSEGMQLTDTHTITRRDFEEFGRRIGLAPRIIKRELDFFSAEQPLAQSLINRSFLSDPLKLRYWQSYNYRRITLE